MLTQVLVAHRRPDSPPLRAMPEFLTNFSFVLFLHFSLFLLRGFSVSVWLPCVDAYTGPGLCSRFLIEQRFLKQQSVAGAGAELSSAALRSPASPALRLQPAAQIRKLCNMRCSMSWPFGSMEVSFQLLCLLNLPQNLYSVITSDVLYSTMTLVRTFEFRPQPRVVPQNNL